MTNRPKTFIPIPLELPLFISSKLREEQNFKRLVKRLKFSEIYQNICKDPCPDVQPKIVDNKLKRRTECIPKPKWNRDLIKDRSWNLAPNRYSIRENLRRPEGYKSCCWSRVKRNDRTIIGHNAVRRPIGIFQMYNIGQKAFGVHCSKYKSKFGLNLRKYRPTSRLMNTEVATCWKDPTYPGPGRYSPKQYPKPKYVPPKPSHIYKYYEQSSVPQMNHFSLDRSLNAPGPGRYDPIKPCPVPNPNKHTTYDMEAIRRKEVAKMRRFRRLKYQKSHLDDVCADPHLTRITGHGHTYRFKENPRAKRLHELSLEAAAEKRGKTVKPSNAKNMFCNTDYIQMIVKPERNNISEPLPGYPPKFSKVRYNTVQKLTQKKRHAANPNVVFMSGKPRWSSDEIHIIFSSKPKTGTAPKQKPPPNLIRSRLHELPARLVENAGIKQRPKYFTFTELPTAKVLVRIADFKLIEEKPAASAPLGDNFDKNFLKDTVL